jgi:hypothetical protein
VNLIGPQVRLRDTNVHADVSAEEWLVPSLPMDDSSETLPCYFIGNKAIPLKIKVMRPYSVRMLINKRRIFNYRLSRVWRSIFQAKFILSCQA